MKSNSKIRCCGISKYTLKQCCNNSTFITKENLNVCIYHVDVKFEDIKLFRDNQQQKLEKKKKANEKKLKDINIKNYNDKLLEKNPCKIPLKDITGKIINFAIVDKEDYNEVMKHTWHQIKQKSNIIYVQSVINNIKISLHHFILGKPEINNVIHHRDHNGLNNKRNNIVVASISLNNQHKFKRENTSSKYIGVTYCKKQVYKWHTQCSKVHLGNYSEEIEAAKIYDTYVYLKYGIEAYTNGLVKYEEIKNIDINTLIKKKECKLPNNISKSTINTYRVRISYNKKLFLSFEQNLDAAKEKLKTFQQDIYNIKLKDKEEHFKKPILRNENGKAILNIHNKNGEIIDTVQVDDDKWHELSQYNWSKTLNYYQSVINGKSILLHRFLINANKGEIVDHINDNNNTINNNTLDNLRINTNSGNNHNRIKSKNKSSQYIGVSANKTRYNAKIVKDSIIYRLGSYKTEVEAAIAYNLKAEDIYKEFANLNKISDENLNKYQDEIIKKLKNAGKLL